MDEVCGIVYKATNKINGKEYVGQTIRTLKLRKRQHVSNAKWVQDNNYFHNAIRKYGSENFDWKIIDTCNSREKLDLLENFYIGYYDTFVGEGYNLSIGGNGNTGLLLSVEDRKKMSVAQSGKNNGMYGKKHSPETRKKISMAAMGKRGGKNNVMYGKKHSVETKKKISTSLMGKFVGEKNSRFGVPLSDEIKKKLSVALTGKNKGKNHCMFGKHLSDETKKKISMANIGKYGGKRHHNAKTVIIGDKRFNTIKMASEFVGVSHSLIRRRILHKTKWLDYSYA